MAHRLSDEYIEQLTLTETTDVPQKSDRAIALPADKYIDSRLAVLVERVARDVEFRPQILSAEHHMGRTTIATQALLKKTSDGVKSRIEDLSHALPDEALIRVQDVARWARKHGAAGCKTIVVFDNLPVGDEYQRSLVVSALRRILASGGMLIIVCDILGELLAQDFTEARCYWSCDLRITLYGDEPYAASFDYMTQGIPRLANAYARAFSQDGDFFGEYMMSDPGYLEAYTRVVEDLVRPELMSEERSLRCVMLLMGQGTLDDLDFIVPTVDRDLWRMIARDVPALGINLSQETFCCVCCHAMGGIYAVYRELEDAAGEIPAYIGSVASLLAMRGEYARSAVVCRLCTDECMRQRIMLRWICEYVNAGEVEFALSEIWAMSGDEREVVHNARTMFSALGLFADGSDSWKRGRNGSVLRIARLEGPDYDAVVQDEEQDVSRRKSMLAAKARHLLGDEASWTFVEPDESDDEIAQALVAHCNAFVYMARGSFEGAYDLLSQWLPGTDRDTVTSALLEMDYLACSLMMGMSPGEGQLAALRNAEAFLQKCGLRALRSMILALPRVAKTLAGREPPKTSFEPCVQRADRAGDTFLRGVFLLANAVADMRTKAYTRAHVRLERAVEDFAHVDATYLNRAARLLDMAVRLHFGEHVMASEIQSCGGISQDMDHLVAIFASAASKQKRRPAGSRLWGNGPCPYSILWLLNVLANDSGSFSSSIQDMLPPRWRDRLVELGTNIDVSYENTLKRLEQTKEPLGVPVDVGPSFVDQTDVIPRLEIGLLGGLQIRVGGTPIQCGALEKRRAKYLLTFLSAVPGHSAPRFTIIESIWPDYDYDAGNQNLYSATSVLRRALGELVDCDVSMPPMVFSRKGAGTVYLNTSRISFDVDLFEQKAHRLLDCEGDNRMAVSLCRDVEELYKGDFVVPSADGAGIMLARATELRMLLADAMIAGSEAAIGLGMRTLACRFARKAYDADNMREDAIRAFVTALCGAGRHIEARRYYDQYVSRVVKSARRPPSRRLREIVEGLLRGVQKKAETERAQDAVPKRPVEIVETHAIVPIGQLKFDFGDAV